ncbi:hypothetical protein FNV43_RR17026 [Rhamnella rubrinervis]|uniref:Uncharacterized protein n=1 Tax=Rhamnella rubrinervis TaxID=2594499 RepID=A0A8K0ME33_9ROSA|nr:hypothetical protein FNV43_RR17026 [Rhamnella rubrinervis]
MVEQEDMHLFYELSIIHGVLRFLVSTEITTKYVKPSYEMTSTGITLANKTITCSANHNAVSSPPTDLGSDSDDDTATISQAIKNRRITSSNNTGHISNPTPRTMTVDNSTPSHTITQVQEDPTIPSPTNLDMTLTVSANSSVDASHEIDPHPIVIIDPPLTETEMPFNSHLIIEDITEAEHNSDVDDFLIDHDSAQNFDCELALMNSFELVQSDKKKIDEAKKVLLEMVRTGFDIITEEEARNNYRKSIAVLIDVGFFLDSMKSTISKFLHSLNEELATFNKFCENIFDAASHHSSMISLQTSIQSKASEYTTASAKLTAQEHLVKELKAKLAKAEDVCGNLCCSI